jgi:sucrose phosphorylase
MKNKVQLITYVDRLSKGGIKSLHTLLESELKGVFGGVHLLPFFYPIDGSDAGFDPIDHTMVDSRLGSWDNIKALSQTTDIMADVIVNHMSAQSPQFLDYLEKGEESIYSDLFLTLDKIFPKGLDEKELSTIYRPRPGSPFTEITFKDGSKKLFWTTFTSNQIDIDVLSKSGKAYLLNILQVYKNAGIKMIRLDAAGYVIKKHGTSCFMITDTFDFIDWFREKAEAYGMEVLVEIHSYYQKQIEIAKRVDWVYDFALPTLVLHAIFNRTSEYLKKWLEISPRNAITVLDTHDGIGVIDVGGSEGQPGLIPEKDIDDLVEQIHINSKGESRLATGEAASNLDLYQVNCTYLDALSRDENNYLLARAIQFFAPGVPQVYYIGLLGEPNDLELLRKTKTGRDINRHFFKTGELNKAFKKPLVQRLIKLINFRNSHSAFDGDFLLHSTDPDSLIITCKNGKEWAKLEVDFNELNFNISFSKEEQEQKLKF